MRKSKREGKFKIDSKEFLVGLVGKTRKIYIEERNERKFGKLELDFDTLAWVRDVQQVLLMRIIPWVFGFWRRGWSSPLFSFRCWKMQVVGVPYYP